MKICLTLLFIVLSLGPIDGFTMGTFISSDEREPQVIDAYENPHDEDRIIFNFCHTKRRETCFVLGSNKEGVLKKYLLGDSKKQMVYRRVVPLGKAISELVLFFSAWKIVTSVGKVGLAFMGGAGITMFQTAFSGETFSRQYFESLSKVLTPERSYTGVTLKLGMGILDFSYRLEKKINFLTSYCMENPYSEACIEYDGVTP